MPLLDPYDAYVAAGTTFSRMAPQGTGTQIVYGTFDEGRRTLLPFVDTGLIYPGRGQAQGDPKQFRYFQGIEFGGAGTLFIRALIDDTEVARGFVVLEQDAYQANYMHLPRGSAGYGLRLQICGLAWWRYFSIDWDPVMEDRAEGEERH